MDRKLERFEVRCSAEELAGWKAVVPPGVPFASWVRGALNAASEKGVVVFEPSLPLPPDTREPRPGGLSEVGILSGAERGAGQDTRNVSPYPASERPFRPDFRGGKP